MGILGLGRHIELSQIEVGRTGFVAHSRWLVASSHPRAGCVFSSAGGMLGRQPVFFFFFTILWLFWVFIAGCGLSLVAESRGYLVIAMLEPLISVASLVAEHRR